MQKTTTFISDNNTRVRNHFMIETDNNFYLQSYNSIVVRYNKRTKRITLGINAFYSMTTKKYVKQFIARFDRHYSTEELHSTFKVERLYLN